MSAVSSNWKKRTKRTRRDAYSEGERGKMRELGM
jgi:hypothetical protein